MIIKKGGLKPHIDGHCGPYPGEVYFAFFTIFYRKLDLTQR